MTIVGGKAVQDNFGTYRVVRINEMPAVETHIVAEGDPMGGIGEPGTPPIAPAVGCRSCGRGVPAAQPGG